MTGTEAIIEVISPKYTRRIACRLTVRAQRACTAGGGPDNCSVAIFRRDYQPLLRFADIMCLLGSYGKYIVCLTINDPPKQTIKITAGAKRPVLPTRSSASIAVHTTRLPYHAASATIPISLTRRVTEEC